MLNTSLLKPDAGLVVKWQPWRTPSERGAGALARWL